MGTYGSSGEGRSGSAHYHSIAGSTSDRPVGETSESLSTGEALSTGMEGTFVLGHDGIGLSDDAGSDPFPIGRTDPLEWTGSDDGSDHMHSLKELRASLAICELILATVVRREPMGSEAADMLQRVATQLGAAVGFLSDVAPSQTGDDSPLIIPPTRDDMLGLIRQVFSSGELLGSAVSLFDVQPALGARLKTVVGDLTGTAQDVWFMAMTAASDTPAL